MERSNGSDSDLEVGLGKVVRASRVVSACAKVKEGALRRVGGGEALAVFVGWKICWGGRRHFRRSSCLLIKGGRSPYGAGINDRCTVTFKTRQEYSRHLLVPFLIEKHASVENYLSLLWTFTEDVEAFYFEILTTVRKERGCIVVAFRHACGL